TRCQAIVSHLTRLGLETERNMLPGLSEAAIHSLSAKLPFALPRSVIDLYKWSEGLRPRTGVGNGFFPGYRMSSLPEMIDTYVKLSSAEDFPRFRAGRKKWFPVFRSGGTDFYGVCCSKREVGDGEVVDDFNESKPAVKFLSLEKMLLTIFRCYEQGVYYV